MHKTKIRLKKLVDISSMAAKAVVISYFYFFNHDYDTFQVNVCYSKKTSFGMWNVGDKFVNGFHCF